MALNRFNGFSRSMEKGKPLKRLDSKCRYAGHPVETGCE